MTATACNSYNGLACQYASGGDGDWDVGGGGRVVAELTIVVISPSVDSAVGGEG